MTIIPVMIDARGGISLPHDLLVLPRAGSRDFAALARKVRLLATRTLLTGVFPTRLSTTVSRPLADVRRVLTTILQRQPDAFLNAIASPDVLPLLLAAQCGSIAADDGIAAAIPNLLGELFVTGAIAENLVWPVAADRIATNAGTWSFPDPARALAVNPTELVVETAGGSLRTLDLASAERVRVVIGKHEPLHLAVADTNPLSMQEAHPDKSGNAVDLGGRSPDEWSGAIEEALALIETAVPEWYAEMTDALLRIVPVGFDAERHLSASYREAPGIIYMTLHPDPLTMAEAIIHETQHGKLNSLTWLDPVLLNGQSHWTSSPVRPDLRPLMGVLLAVHAFVPVAALHYGLALREHPLTKSRRFEARRRDVLATNAQGLETVRKDGQPTEIGKQLIDALARLHEVLAGPAPPH